MVHMDVKIKAELDPHASAEDIFQTLLKSRGYLTPNAQAEFLHPVAPTLPLLLKESGIKKSTLANIQKLLDSHLTAGHDILVFGDYDADGVTATAIMWQTIIAYAKLNHSKARILPFIPLRHRHGYGLSELAIEEINSGTAFKHTQFPDFSPQLIITVDTGIVAVDVIKKIRAQKYDVIITDHHLPDVALPPANHILHTTMTSGAGVAWILSLYLLGESAKALLDLATIGVVADMMPLRGINRSLVAHGLSNLTRSRRPGLVAIKALMGIGERDLTTYDISFGIAPRINASGRIYNPLDALRLLCTSDRALATNLATTIESHNKDRQDYTDSALQTISSHPVKHHILVVIGDYHEGVIGLVAGKLVEKFHRPAVVMSQAPDVVKGSTRSLPGINITELLRSLKTPFLGLGGHEAAAGFSLPASQVKNFTAELKQLADQTISPSQLIKSESADLSLALSQTTLKLAELLGELEPFGISNPKPRFLLHDLQVLEDRPLGGGKHHKLTVEQGSTTREVLMFNTQHSHPVSQIKQLICTLDINLWRDKKSLQLIASYVET